LSSALKNSDHLQIQTLLQQLAPTELAALTHDWHVWARDTQLPPLTTAVGHPWRTWLFLGGRGAGKTRAGAEWIRAAASGGPLRATAAVKRNSQRTSGPRAKRLALLGPTIQHVRAVMIEGVSGLLAIHPDHERPTFEPSKNQLVWPNGTIAQMFAADEYETLRGPQFDAAWCDELCRWRRPQAAWDMLQFALRLGDNPRAVITTTPKVSQLLKNLVKDPFTAVTHDTTAANRANLAETFLTEVTRRYAGTALGEQELEGQIVEQYTGGLWRRDWLAETRIEKAPALSRIVVAVDPPVSSHATSDACGIIVAGLGVDGRGYVLADRTIKGREPQVWARAAIAAYHDFQADRLVAEVNQGGDLVVLCLHTVDDTVPVKKVRATRAKITRAEPISALYAEGRVSHVGEFLQLENQMIGFDGTSPSLGSKSPDRLDALVWALTDLMLTTSQKPIIRSL
jgi:phage terminase large subunit-like protein